jgi:hypothetical protein
MEREMTDDMEQMARERAELQITRGQVALVTAEAEKRGIAVPEDVIYLATLMVDHARGAGAMLDAALKILAEDEAYEEAHK